MNRWRSFLLAAGVAVVGVSGYFITTEDGRVLPTGARERVERGRFGRDGSPTTPTCPAVATPAELAAAQSAPCACAQVNAGGGILVVSRGVETLSGDVSPEYAYCAKGSRTSLHVGDLVGCAANLPRIQPTNADGTGALTVLTEPRRRNFTALSSQFNLWQTVAVTAAAPTVVANAAIAPDGTTTADLVQLKATGAGDISSLFQNSSYGGGCPFDGGAGRLTASVYAAGAVDAGFPADGGTGTFDICTYTGSAWECNQCTVSAYNPTGAPDGGATGWTRCSHADYVTDTNVTPLGYFHIGNASAVSGAARPLQGFYLAKAQCEGSTTATSPIDTDTRQTVASADIVSVQEPACRAANARTSWVGDSLSGLETVGDTSPLLATRPPEVYAATTSRTVDNWAHNGDKVADAILQWTNYGDRTRAQRIVFWAGINDVIGDSANGTTLAGTVSTWIAARAAEGKFVTWVGLAPCKAYSGWSAGKQTQLLSFNTAASTYCGANPTQCVYVDIYAALTDGADNLDPAYEAPDHLHLNQAGATEAGNTIAAASP